MQSYRNKGHNVSLQTLTTIAAERDQGVPKKKTSKRSAEQAPDADSPLSNTDVLIAAIPTEVLALYTGLVTAITVNISSDAGADRHLFMRWILYAVGFCGIVAWLGVNYVRGQHPKTRRFPFAETAAAVVAFAAWGLVMPGSPLAEALSKDNRNIWYPIIVTAALLVMGLIGVPLRQKTKKASR